MSTEVLSRIRMPRRHGFVRRSLPLLLSVVATLLASAGCAGSSDDGEMRDKAVAAYTQTLSQETQDAIAINVKKNIGDYDPAYYWSGGGHTLVVNVRLGSCATVTGMFINVPDRPTSAQQLGEVLLTLPSTIRNAPPAQVSARAPNLYAEAMVSALAHCVAGDPRLQPHVG